MKSNSSSASGGIGFVGLLTILFIGLKLTGYVLWSWLWVLSPLWIPIALGLMIFSVIALIAVASAGGRKGKYE